MSLVIAAVAEGETEVACFRPLVERVWAEVLGRPDWPVVCRPRKGLRDKLVADADPELTDELEAALLVAEAESAARGGVPFLVVVMVDAEADDGDALEARLRQRAHAARPDQAHRVDCAVPVRMIEAWFVAAAESLRGVRGLPADFDPPADLARTNAKRWIEDAVRLASQNRRNYNGPLDGPAFVASMDLTLAQNRSASFRRFRDLIARHAPSAV